MSTNPNLSVNLVYIVVIIGIKYRIICQAFFRYKRKFFAAPLHQLMHGGKPRARVTPEVFPAKR